jgi:hypothetical protein
LLGIEGVNDIVGVLEQILKILLGLFNFPRTLSYLILQLFSVGFQLLLEPLPVGNVPQLHHHRQLVGFSDPDQRHFGRGFQSVGMADHDLLRGHFPLP